MKHIGRCLMTLSSFQLTMSHLYNEDGDYEVIASNEQYSNINLKNFETLLDLVFMGTIFPRVRRSLMKPQDIR